MAAILKVYFALVLNWKTSWLENLVGSIRVTCISKEQIGNDWKSKMAARIAFLKIYFVLLLLSQKASWHERNLVGRSGQLADWKKKKNKIITIPWIFSLSQPKSQSTRILVGGKGETCTSKVAKTVPTENSRITAMVAILKIYFAFLLLKQKANWLETC